MLLLRARHHSGMTLSDCPSCGRRELRGARSIHALATGRGAVLVTTCRGCGAELAVGSSRVVRPAAARDIA